jgi:hypothetical protein
VARLVRLEADGRCRPSRPDRAAAIGALDDATRRAPRGAGRDDGRPAAQALHCGGRRSRGHGRGRDARPSAAYRVGAGALRLVAEHTVPPDPERAAARPMP